MLSYCQAHGQPMSTSKGLMRRLITPLRVPFIPRSARTFITCNEVSIFLTVLPCHPACMGNAAFLGRLIYGPHYANGLYVTQRDRCNARGAMNNKMYYCRRDTEFLLRRRRRRPPSASFDVRVHMYARTYVHEISPKIAYSRRINRRFVRATGRRAGR